MLPGIRAVIAVIGAAVGLLMIAFVLAAAFRVAQESRAASLQADLAQRGRAEPPVHRPIAIIETPAPTVLAAAPATPERAPDPVEAAPAPETPIVEVFAAAEESVPPVLDVLPPATADTLPPVLAYAPPQPETPAPVPTPRPDGIGGPSPEEVAAAHAEHEASRGKLHRLKSAKVRSARRAHVRARRVRLAARAREQTSTATPKSYGLFGVAPENRQ